MAMIRSILGVSLLLLAQSAQAEPYRFWEGEMEILSQSGRFVDVEKVAILTIKEKNADPHPSSMLVTLGEQSVLLPITAIYDLECRTYLYFAENGELELSLRDEVKTTCWDYKPWFWFAKLRAIDAPTRSVLEMRANPHRAYPVGR